MMGRQNDERPDEGIKDEDRRDEGVMGEPAPASRDSTQELSVVGDAGMAGEGTKQNEGRQDEGMMGNKMMRTRVHSQKLGSKPLY